MKTFPFILVFLLMLISWPATAETRARPKLELGFALGGQYLADYRGSNEYNTKVLPVPFFIYRGDRIKVDRKGLRSELINSPWWELNVSGEVSLSGGQEGNSARINMPELDSAFEIGPSLNIALDGDISDDGWLLRIPLRTVVGISGSGFDHIGYVVNPKLTYTNTHLANSWRFRASLGLSYADNDYHEYYYEVAPQYVLSDRAAYRAHAGYSGSFSKISLSRRSGLWNYGISVRYDNISGTDFAKNSPLVKTNDYFAVSFIVAKFLWASKN